MEMKVLLKVLIGLGFLLSQFESMGQITIDESDLPVAGSEYFRIETTALGQVNPADNSGENVLWDYSDLPEGNFSLDSLFSVGDTPIAYQLYFNNQFLYPDNLASYARPTDEFDFAMISVNNAYEYYRVDTVGYYQVGFGATINGVPLSIPQDTTDRILEFPLEYGNTDTSNSYFLASVPALGTLGRDQVREVEVDGWGTLELPGETFECLRVKSTINAVDTIYIASFEIGQTIEQPETVRYQWYAQGMGQPVLQIDVVGGAPTVARYWAENTIGTEEVSMNEFSLFPNPSSGQIQIESENPLRSIVVYDITGKQVFTRDIGAGRRYLSLDLSELKAGIYLLKAVDSQGGEGIRRFSLSR